MTIIWFVRPPVIEEAYEETSGPPEVAVEVGYEGSYRLTAPSEGEGDGKETSLFPGWGGPRSSAGDALRSRSGSHSPGKRSDGGNLELAGGVGGLDSGPSRRPRARVPPAGRARQSLKGATVPKGATVLRYPPGQP